MPYKGEYASKGGHSDFVKNPDVKAFLSECEYMREPSDSEAKFMADMFHELPRGTLRNLPNYVVASDASKSDTPINEKLPSTQIGFIKVSQVLVEMDHYNELTDPCSRFVDPFKAAEMHRNASAITFTLPGSNIRYQGAKSVKDGFRRAIFNQLNMDRGKEGNRFILTETLLLLNDDNIEIKCCPSCGSDMNFIFSRTELIKKCYDCKEDIFLTDWLRLHEDVSDFGNNTSAMTRMMNVIEHLLLAAILYKISASSPRALSAMAFVMDGPLAIFGQPAKLHKRMMSLIFKINKRLSDLDLEPLLIIGLQKTGEVMDHANLLNKFLPNNVYKLLDDEYRFKFIKGNDSPTDNFGDETYYGQDFLFKTDSGNMFCFALPYPYENKSCGKREFSRRKTKPESYGSLIIRACDLIRYFEFDLYQNAIVPVALAHRHASISIMPGGKVLDILTKTGMKNN